MDNTVLNATIQACAAAQVQVDAMSLELIISLHSKISEGEDLTLSQISKIKNELAIKYGFIKPEDK